MFSPKRAGGPRFFRNRRSVGGHRYSPECRRSAETLSPKKPNTIPARVIDHRHMTGARQQNISAKAKKICRRYEFFRESRQAAKVFAKNGRLCQKMAPKLAKSGPKTAPKPPQNSPKKAPKNRPKNRPKMRPKMRHFLSPKSSPFSSPGPSPGPGLAPGPWSLALACPRGPALGPAPGGLPFLRPLRPARSPGGSRPGPRAQGLAPGSPGLSPRPGGCPGPII